MKRHFAKFVHLKCLRLYHLVLAAGCDGSPLLPLLYVATNVAFNISLLNLVKISSAVVSSLAVMLSGALSLLCMLKTFFKFVYPCAHIGMQI